MFYKRKLMRDMTILLLLLFLFSLMLVFADLDGQSSAQSSDYTEYTIVGLFPLTGPLSSFAENSVAAANLAVADINDWLADGGKDWRLNLEIEDTQLNPEVALGLMQHWHEEEGVDFFVGPMGSGVAGACLDYANDNEILFISPSSTSPWLAIDDWFFRFVVDDTLGTKATAALIDETGVQDLIIGWRGDDWGDWYQTEIVNAVADLNPAINIHGSDEFRYTPGQSDFGDEVESLNDFVTVLVGQNVALEDIGFLFLGSDDEVAAFLTEADSYAQLKGILWFGSEWNALSEDLLSHPVATQFAADVGFIFPLQRPDLVLPEQSYYEYVRDYIQTELGREPDIYAYVTNDIICVLALSFDTHGYNSEAVKEALPDITDSYTAVYGASGHIVLNEYGDRAYADYALWVINNQNVWQEVGYYEGVSGNIFWYDLPTFTDVNLNMQFYPYIEAIYAAGITTGYGDGTFRPYDPVNRGQMVAFIARALELPDAGDPNNPSFTDVPSGMQFFGYIEAIYADGITTGYGDNTYRPYDTVTRGQMAAFLSRALDLTD